MASQERGQWGSKIGFIFAASGSAVGLGNIWKFPYITGENGGGWFVLIYLVSIVFIGLPIMISEFLIGKASQTAPVGAFRKYSKPNSPWVGLGWIALVTSFIILSYYSVVAGWAMNYTWLSFSSGFSGMEGAAISELFGEVYANPWWNTFWHTAFMATTIFVVAKGVQGGIELCSRILMPILFALLLLLFVYSMTAEGFKDAFAFVFMPDASKLTSAAVLEAVGHSFFSLGIGLGALLTYGSYLSAKENVVTTSITIAALDTLVAITSCLILFPIIFSVGLEPGQGPGLVFVSIPIAFSQMTGGAILAPLFFLLLTFTALTSAISLLEVVVATFVDEKKWSRVKSATLIGFAIFIFGIPSALSGGTELFGGKVETLTAFLLGEGDGKNWFDFFDYLSSNWLLPLGGLGVALFVGWRMDKNAIVAAFETSKPIGKVFWGWMFLLRYIVPIAILAVFLHVIGLY